MAVTKTKKQAHDYMGKLKGKWWDFDGAFGAQCFDLANMYWNYLTGGRLAGYYAKDIPTANNFDGLATVHKNTPGFLPQKGDIVIFHGGYGGGAGHVAIVWSANLNSFVSLDQNWYGGAQNNPPEVAQLITHYYDNPMYFIRPNYKTTVSTVSKVKDKVTPAKKSSSKGKKILIVAGHGLSDPGAIGNGTNERDFIRSKIAPNVVKYLKQAGHRAELYGGSKMNQNLFADTNYGNQRGDTKNYGLYWVKQQKFDIVVELHLDAAGATASGGHVIKNAYAADSIDKNIDKMLKATVGTIRGITTRDNLLNCNVAYRLNINYRLVEMGFITNKKDMDYLKKNYDAFSKELAGAINGKPIGGAPAGKTSTKPQAVKKAKQTVWNWKGRFTANTTVKVRRSPGLKGKVVDSGSWIYKNQWVDIVQIKKQDKYWWGKFKFPTNPGAGYFWMALTPITDKQEKIKNEKKMYGKMNWK